MDNIPLIIPLVPHEHLKNVCSKCKQLTYCLWIDLGEEFVLICPACLSTPPQAEGVTHG